MGWIHKWRIGTSGWTYKHWKGVVYPSGVPVSKWLRYHSAQFDTIEVNATFYRLPKPDTFERWYRETPEDFLWAVKGSKFITHTRGLKDSGEPLERLYGGLSGLREKLGPILFQLPPRLSYNKNLLLNFCDHLDHSKLHALEIRHPSWIVDQVFQILKEHEVAFCFSDTAGRYPYHETFTADFLYIRLHGSRKMYASEYTEEELQAWARKIRSWDMEAYVYFDNDFGGFAVNNAKRLREILAV
jgi:uncharacterized protein YecE (DUF72 family)